MDSVENPVLKETIEPENDLKNQLVEYVGEKLNPEDGNVTVEMLVEVMSQEFPEFLLAIAEENWIRGYHQGLVDIEEGMKISQNLKKEEASGI